MKRSNLFQVAAFGPLLAFVLPISRTAGAEPSFPVSIRVDASKSVGEMKPIWRFFGADEPNYATMKDGRRLLSELGSLRPKDVYFRAHNLLSTGDGTPALKWGSTNAYTEDAQGGAVYRLGDPRQHLRHLQSARRSALRGDRIHARSPFDSARALPARMAARP